MTEPYDVTIIGAGAAGMIAAIVASTHTNRVLLLEKLPKIGAKLKATGGGRCNLTNTLPKEEFMNKFGKHGRFMREALDTFDAQSVQTFFNELGVPTHSPDGFRVFPQTHDSLTVLDGLSKKLEESGVEIMCAQAVENIDKPKEHFHIQTQNDTFYSSKVIIATGGLGYPTLGANGDGYHFASSLGHAITSLHPAMMPLLCKEQWVANCTADTIAKASIKVDLKKYKKLKAVGDLIFTKKGIRGPVVLDFSREITPILASHEEVPLLVNLTKGMNEEEILKAIKLHPTKSIAEAVSTFLAKSVALELCQLCCIQPEELFKNIEGKKREQLVKMLVWTPLTITGHEGFKHAMITRGGVKLKEIEPKNMQSRIIPGLYFCGEVMDLDGPCGGYNLQWSFSSGYLAGLLQS